MTEYSPFKLWTIAEVSKVTGLSVYQVRKMIAENKLKATRVGAGLGSLRVAHSEVMRLAGLKGGEKSATN